MSTELASTPGLDLAPSAAERPAGPSPAGAGRTAGGLRAKARGFLGRRKALDAVADSPRAPRRLWRGFAFRTGASLGKASAATATPAYIRDADAEPTPAQKRERAKVSWREQRWERRRKRRFAEEVLGWILVPIIVLSGYWAVKSGLTALGTSPSALIQNVKSAISSKS